MGGGRGVVAVAEAAGALRALAVRVAAVALGGAPDARHRRRVPHPEGCWPKDGGGKGEGRPLGGRVWLSGSRTKSHIPTQWERGNSGGDDKVREQAPWPHVQHLPGEPHGLCSQRREARG